VNDAAVRERSAPGPAALALPAVEAPATVAAAVAALAHALSASGVADARQTARDLLAALADAPRSWAITQAGSPYGTTDWAAAEAAARRLVAGAPFAYAVGRAPFRHLVLAVDERVLIPRPETELLVDAVLAAVTEPGGVVIDVGTGSGAIALALASEGRFARVIATDLSRDALHVAAANAARVAAVLRAPVEFRQGSLLAPAAGERARVVVSNPPYISYGEAAALPASVRDWEPPLALYSGDDGSAATLRLVDEAAAVLEPHGLLALEVDSRRARAVAERVAADPRYTRVQLRSDLTGRDRFVTARRA
jgi:release factor glutamine methyltransferase